MDRSSVAWMVVLAALLLVAVPLARAGSVGCVNDDEGADDACPQGCATGEVVIPQGQRCGGDRNGCCQSTNIGPTQNQYPACKNPHPETKPAYCSNSIKPGYYWTPWDCDDMRCAANNICVCNTGDCTCQSKSNFSNIRNNGKGFSAEACGQTHFASIARAHGTDGGEYACQIK